MTDAPRFKLLPRNLTSRADILVVGNSADTRPESGVENCFPGLEFDQRNLDKRFFEGLTFELHHSDGVILRETAPGSPAGQVFTAGDLTSPGVFLAFVEGLFSSRSSTAPAARIVSMLPPAGLEAWRLIRDLEPGRVGVLLADSVAFNLLRRGVDIDLPELFKQGENTSVDLGEGRALLLFAQRARYVDEHGVIPEALAAPGELTQSLCSPWQYDFADCGCFYWASNKPDLVSTEDQPNQVLNFQRRDRSVQSDKSAAAEDWITKQQRGWDGRQFTMGHAETMARWMDLPFVVGRTETDRYRVAAAPGPLKPLTRDEIVDRLKKLAAVEHALAVEYLYAYYSFGLPLHPPAGLALPQRRVAAAANELFQVAVDEMRHLRAVNEMLADLGEASVLDRAQIIGEDFDGPGTGFKHQFVLRPCVPDHLKWFVDVERESQTSNGQNTIDGMYTLILRNILQGGLFTKAQSTRLASSIKVIIDEGIDHYGRFVAAQKFLEGMPPVSYLRVQDAAPVLAAAGSPERILQDVTDAAYLVMLRSLDFVFSLGDRQRGAMLEAARRAMYNMDDAARSLSAGGHGALFNHGRFGEVKDPAAGVVPLGAAPDLAWIGEPLAGPLQILRAGNSSAQRLADRMTDRLDVMLNAFRAAGG